MEKRHVYGVLALVVPMILTARPAEPAPFGITSLGATGSSVIEHDGITGDDRGGIAVSSAQVFYTGDNETGRFTLADLSGGTGVGTQYDALVSDLAAGTVYSLGDGVGPKPFGGGPVTRLLEIDGSTGALTGGSVTLSASIGVGAGTGIFAGSERVVLHDGSDVFSIAVSSGTVTFFGTMGSFGHTVCESWAYWGVVEEIGADLYLVLGRVDPERVVEFLLLHPTFPRSVRFCLEAATQALATVAGGTGLIRAERILGRALADLKFIELEQVMRGELHGFLDRFVTHCVEVSHAVQEHYSPHV